MKHTIDLQKYNLRTDLTIEKIKQSDYKNPKIDISKYKDIVIEKIKLSS